MINFTFYSLMNLTKSSLFKRNSTIEMTNNLKILKIILKVISRFINSLLNIHKMEKISEKEVKELND